MGQLRDRMVEDLLLRGYAHATVRTYVAAVRGFARWTGRAPDTCGTDEVRAYL
jgi:hypothetical protein